MSFSARPAPGIRWSSKSAMASAYRAASTTAQETAAWRPPYLSADAAILPDKDITEARVADLGRNNPHARAAISRLLDMLVGAGLRLSAKPDAAALGLTPEQTRAVRRQIEAEWRLFAYDPLRRCDAQRKVMMPGLLRQLGRRYITSNECAAVLKWRPDGGTRYATCVRVVHPARISNPSGAADKATLRGGLEITAEGEVVAAHIRNRHPGDWIGAGDGSSWERVPARTDWGRPIFIHGFEPEEEDQARGVTPFAALMVQLRMLGKHADHELAAAAVNALFAAFVKSNLPQAEATALVNIASSTFADERLKFYEKNPPRIGGVRIPVLPIGDEIAMNNAPRQSAAFRDFQSAFLQSIASALGLSYEQLAMDWSRTNYSSARAALNEVWRAIRRLFSTFVDQVVAPIYLAFLEEAFDRGYVSVPAGAPAFWDMPGAWTQARWIGPGRGYVDPVKEAQAAGVRIDGVLSTLEAECAEQGGDWEEVIDQIAFENEVLAEKGVQRVTTSTATIIAAEAAQGADAAPQAEGVPA
ncbi:phage portal protein [Labrys wisconsinensis]|uniref:Lambda family phage portal protein n=1 Tax=Labrys wisconsinensis TaxID=425677 RepID=A0ABU0JEV2_9HYPH|nr:phage portal protein [Labrys wisconsinensis]MDQ0472807.1 lambda family phage portal protein [Labrys wisconsinensis]